MRWPYHASSPDVSRRNCLFGLERAIGEGKGCVSGQGGPPEPRGESTNQESGKGAKPPLSLPYQRLHLTSPTYIALHPTLPSDTFRR